MVQQRNTILMITKHNITWRWLPRSERFKEKLDLTFIKKLMNLKAL